MYCRGKPGTGSKELDIVITGQNIICFSSDWCQDPLSKHHIISRLSQSNRILWINSIGLRTPTVSVKDASRVLAKLKSFFRGAQQINKNLFVISPVAIPFHGVSFFKPFNQLLLWIQLFYYTHKFKMTDCIIWSFLPNTGNLLGFFREKLSLYYITDDFTKFDGYPSETIEKAENELIDRCDCIIASAKELARKKQRSGKPVNVVNHGVNHAHFASALDIPADRFPFDIKDIAHPVLGFYGELNTWIDLPMIAEAAKKRLQWSFVLIGRVAVEAGDIGFLQKIPNIHLLGQKKYEELPSYCAAFDAALIPMKINDLTICVNPLKLREYLAAGVPVISALLPEVKPYADVVKFASTADELITAFEEIQKEERFKDKVTLSRRVENEGWDGKVEEISEIIQQAIVKKNG